MTQIGMARQVECKLVWLFGSRGPKQIVIKQQSTAPATSHDTANTVPAPETSPSTPLQSSCMDSGFHLAPSLVQAMQRMPDEFPEIVSASGATQEKSNAPADQSTREIKPLQEVQDEGIKPCMQDIVEHQKEEGALGKQSDRNLQRDYLPGMRYQIDNDLLQSMEQLLDDKNRLLDEARKSNEELLGLRKDLVEAQTRLKRNAIYIKSLDDYVDELETKIKLQSPPSTGTQVGQVQAGTQAESTTTSDPNQQTDLQQNVPVGDAVYRWQAYMIERLEQENERLAEECEDLKEKEEKAFSDALHFEKTLHDNNKVYREHLELCHESKVFPNKDMAENLTKMRAVCEERSESVYGSENTEDPRSAVVNPESTSDHRQSACVDAFQRLCSSVDTEAHVEQCEGREGVQEHSQKL